MTENDKNLVERIDDLIKQATTERSHYYTASLLLEVRARLVELLPKQRARKEPAPTV